MANLDLSGQTALVTGASRGIGRAIALELAANGAHVLGTATSESGTESFMAAMSEAGAGGAATGLVVDVADAASVAALFETLQADGKLPGILVNNAGITRDNLLARMTEDDWEAVIQTNLTSLYRTCKACVRHLMKARGGRIINVGSVVGSLGNAGQTSYAAAKAGLLGFTRSLARELGPRGITVNAVAPGFIATDMTDNLAEKQREALIGQIPLGRLGQVSEVAAAVAFLASPAGAYITGETLHINGGMYMG